MTTDQQILDLFVDQGIVQRSQIEDILAEINNSGKTLLQVMIDFEIVNEEQYYRDHRRFHRRGLRRPGRLRGAAGNPAAHSRRHGAAHGALPIGQSGESIVTALLDPLDNQVVDDLRFALGRDIQVVVAPAYQVAGAPDANTTARTWPTWTTCSRN